jgi:hypothetical protein
MKARSSALQRLGIVADDLVSLDDVGQTDRGPVEGLGRRRLAAEEFTPCPPRGRD